MIWVDLAVERVHWSPLESSVVHMEYRGTDKTSIIWLCNERIGSMLNQRSPEMPIGFLQLDLHEFPCWHVCSKCRTSFFFRLWKYMFSFSSYRINCIHVYIWFHPLCTACAIVLFWILFQTLLSFNMLGCYRSQSLSASCTTSAICARSLTALGTCHKWSSLGICCKSAAVPCMPSWISWFWHPHSHVAVASTFLG